VTDRRARFNLAGMRLRAILKPTIRGISSKIACSRPNVIRLALRSNQLAQCPSGRTKARLDPHDLNEAEGILMPTGASRGAGLLQWVPLLPARPQGDPGTFKASLSLGLLHPDAKGTSSACSPHWIAP
jgi:hypothetical protein